MSVQHETSHDGGHDMAAMVRSNERALIITSALTGFYFVIELALGILSGSVAVLSDAFHTFSAVGGVLIALVADRIARQPADRYRTFGSVRAEIIGALLNGLFLFGMAAFVVYMGVMRLLMPVAIETTLMLWAAAGGLVTEAISIWLLFGAQKSNLNMRGAFWHVLQTFVGSLIIIVTAAVVWTTGFVAIDPILGMAFGLALFWASWGIMRDSIRILMGTVPADVDVRAICQALGTIKGVRNVHHVHAWTLTTGKNLFSAHILIDDQAATEDVLTQATGLLADRFGFYFSTVQVERRCHDSEQAAEIDFADPAPTH
jgi:cobalt-zinc-cadmium efflux system protein